MRDNSSPEVVEKKPVSLYELREQILDSFTKILTTTVSNDAFIEKMHPKILDLIGDLSLVGFSFFSHIIAIRSGHFSNTCFAKEIYNQIIMENSQ